MPEDQITAIKNQLGGIYDRLTKIETMLAERCQLRGEELDDLEKRVRYLELDRSKIIGGAIAASVLVSALSVLAGHILKIWGN